MILCLLDKNCRTWKCEFSLTCVVLHDVVGPAQAATVVQLLQRWELCASDVLGQPDDPLPILLMGSWKTTEHQPEQQKNTSRSWDSFFSRMRLCCLIEFRSSCGSMRGPV